MEDSHAPRIRLISVLGDGEESTDNARTRVYLEELDRQARIFSTRFLKAWTASLDDSQEITQEVFPDLQAALFAAIVVQRILYPSRSVKRYPHHLKRAESVEQARNRGAKLRELLGVPDDAALATVGDVRDAFEHVDERLDALMRPGVTSFSDWYISHGRAMVTPLAREGATGYGLRMFLSPGGVLYFDDASLDLYALDIAMLVLRRETSRVVDELTSRASGRLTYGGQQMVDLMPVDVMRRRQEEWRQMRGNLGAAVPPALEWSGYS